MLVLQLYIGLLYTCCDSATFFKYRVEVYKYIHVYVQHSRERSTSPSESRNIESRALCLKKSIAARGERGRKINDGIRKGMPLRRQAAVIDFVIRTGRCRFLSR